MKTWIVLLIGLSLTVFLASFVDAYNQNFLAKTGLENLNNDIFYRTLGEFKDCLSDISYLKSDVYYHGGIYHFDEDEHGAMADEMIDAKSVHEHNHVPPKIEPSLNILLDISNATEMTEHKHLSGKEEREVLPWLYYAVKLNPHNEKAYSVGGFWLAVMLEKPNEAIEFLKTGLKNNPESWDICQTLGLIYFSQKMDYDTAKFYLKKAKEFCDRQKVDKFDKRIIYTLLAETYIKTGEKDKAFDLYKELIPLFPEEQVFKNKMQD